MDYQQSHSNILQANNNANNEQKFICVICQKPTLNCCINCKQVFYCGQTHQKAHWKQHRQECKQIQSSKEKQRDVNLSSSSILKRQNQQRQYDEDYIYQHSKFQENKIRKESEELKQIMNKKQKDKQELEIGLKQRKELRGIIFQVFSEQSYEKSILIIKKLVKVSEQIINLQLEIKEEEVDKYEYIADMLLLVKAYQKVGKIKSARTYLMEIYDITHDYIQYILQQQQYFYTQNTYVSSNNNFLAQLNNNNFTEEVENVFDKKQKQEALQHVKKQCNLYSLIGNLFYTMGDYKNTENCYVQYAKLVEKFYGKESLESSNSYYQIAVFYLQHKFYIKSLSTFRMTLQIRKQLVGENHPTVLDCWFNVSLVYKNLEKFEKAMDILEYVLRERRKQCGEKSLQASLCLEIMGKIQLQIEEYRKCLEYLKECYEIRKKEIKDLKNPDMVRISILILHFYNTIEVELEQDDNTKLQTNILERIQDDINDNILDDNLNTYLDQEFDVLEQLKNDLLWRKQELRKQEELQEHISELPPVNIDTKVNQNHYDSNTSLMSMDDTMIRSARSFAQGKRKKKSNFIFKIDVDLMQVLQVRQMELLIQLNEEIRSNMEENTGNFEIRDLIYQSEFMQTIEHQEQYELLRESNPDIFQEENFQEIQEQMRQARQRLEEQKRQIELDLKLKHQQEKSLQQSQQEDKENSSENSGLAALPESSNSQPIGKKQNIFNMKQRTFGLGKKFGNNNNNLNEQNTNTATEILEIKEQQEDSYNMNTEPNIDNAIIQEESVKSTSLQDFPKITQDGDFNDNSYKSSQKNSFRMSASPMATSKYSNKSSNQSNTRIQLESVQGRKRTNRLPTPSFDVQGDNDQFSNYFNDEMMMNSNATPINRNSTNTQRQEEWLDDIDKNLDLEGGGDTHKSQPTDNTNISFPEIQSPVVSRFSQNMNNKSNNSNNDIQQQNSFVFPRKSGQKQLNQQKQPIYNNNNNGNFKNDNMNSSPRLEDILNQ